MILVSTLMLIPLLALFGWRSEWENSMGFFIPALSCAGMGMILWRVFESKERSTLTVADGGIIVFLTWVLACVFSAFPFILIEGMTFTQAIFESVSGWTTTGLTMVTEEETSNMVLLWRSTIQLAGGAGFAIMMLAAITGPVGVGFTQAEGRDERLAPHVKESAKLVIKLYITYVIIGILGYIFVGLTLFDSVNHTFTAVATGGFSTKNASIGHWNSWRVEMVTLGLMFLGNLNFLTSYWLFTGKWRSFFRNGEIRVLIMLTLIGTGIMFYWLTWNPATPMYDSWTKTLRVALFEPFSAVSGTGFSTVDYGEWSIMNSHLGWFVMIIWMIVGGGICSTAGALKQYRVHLFLKSIWWQIKRPFRSGSAVVKNYIWKGDHKKYISDDHLKNVANYVFLYFMVFLIGSMIISIYGHSIKDSMFEFASALGTVGLSVGITGPDAPIPLLWTEILGMFLGRLEFFVVFVSIVKIFKDIFKF